MLAIGLATIVLAIRWLSHSIVLDEPELPGVSTLRNLSTAIIIYRSSYPGRGYPSSLKQLAGDEETCKSGTVSERQASDDTPCGKASSSKCLPLSTMPGTEHAACLIANELATGKYHGYFYRYQPGSIGSSGRINSFTVNADPLNPNEPRHFHYFVDETVLIRVNTNGRATAQSPVFDHRNFKNY